MDNLESQDSVQQLAEVLVKTHEPKLRTAENDLSELG